MIAHCAILTEGGNKLTLCRFEFFNFAYGFVPYKIGFKGTNKEGFDEKDISVDDVGGGYGFHWAG